MKTKIKKSVVLNQAGGDPGASGSQGKITMLPMYIKTAA